MSVDQLQYPNPSHSQFNPQSQPKDSHSSNHAPFRELHSNHVASISSQQYNSGVASTTMPKESNPYVSPAPATSGKSTYSYLRFIVIIYAMLTDRVQLASSAFSFILLF